MRLFALRRGYTRDWADADLACRTHSFRERHDRRDGEMAESAGRIMIWTRRAFLQIAVSTVGCVATASVARAPNVSEEEPARALPADLCSVQLVNIAVTNEGTIPGMFEIGRRGGDSLLRVALAPQVLFHWSAAPGSEIIIGPSGLQNRSDLDVLIHHVGLQYRGRRYIYNEGCYGFDPSNDGGGEPLPDFQLALVA